VRIISMKLWYSVRASISSTNTFASSSFFAALCKFQHCLTAFNSSANSCSVRPNSFRIPRESELALTLDFGFEQSLEFLVNFSVPGL